MARCLVAASVMLVSFNLVVADIAADPSDGYASYFHCEGIYATINGSNQVVAGWCGVPLSVDQPARGRAWQCIAATVWPPERDLSNCTAWVWAGDGSPTIPEPPVAVSRLGAGAETEVLTGVPSTATAVLANLTMVDGATPGYITADTCAALVPGPQTQSNGNHDRSTAIANLSVVPVDSNGKFCVFNQAGVNLVIDVQGYFATSSAGGDLFASVGPIRLIDTRVQPLSRPFAGSITRVNTGAAPGTSAVLVNLTMVDGQQPGYITADRCGALVAGPQTRSSGNHPTSTAIANLAVVPVDADGAFCIYNQQPVNLVVDLQGAFAGPPSTGLKFTPSEPLRKLDTRVGVPAGPTAGSITRVSTGAAPGTSAVLVNLTMTDGAASGYITADRCSVMVAGPQTKSSGNHQTATAIANLAVVPVDADGAFCIYNQRQVNLVVDMQGSFSATGTHVFFSLPSPRVLDTRIR